MAIVVAISKLLIPKAVTTCLLFLGETLKLVKLTLCTIATINKKAPIATEKRHPLDRKFKTVEEAAQAKTDYLVNVIMKDFDWSKPIKDHLR